MTEHNLDAFQKNSGTRFKDVELLQTAFTHRSYINEHPGEASEHNERLEFLGDAVLELTVTEYLFGKYPDKTEGDLTSYRAALVNTSTLATVATGLGINDYLRLSKGEARDAGRARQYILANTLEALIGALYLDQGYKGAQAFVARHILPLADDVVTKGLWRDAKSRLQEVAQDKLSVTPHYQVLEEEGPDHDKQFTVGVFFEEKQIEIGRGNSKQEAQQDAAQRALDTEGWE